MHLDHWGDEEVSSKGQGLLIIAMIVVIAVLILAMLYRIFTMTPAYVYQRSIYFVFKYNPQLVVQGLSMKMNTALYALIKNYSQFLLNYGIAIQMPVLQGGSLAPISLANAILNEYYNTIINTVYTPTGLAIQTGNGNYTTNLNTNYYGALSLLNYIYAANQKATLYASITNTYNMPILGINNLTLKSTYNLTTWIVKPSTTTCKGTIRTTTYSTITKCTFNFISNTYTCTNPAYTKSGAAMNLWAPSYNALINDYMSVSNGIVDSNTQWAGPVVFLYPVDEASANNGFEISAVFSVTSKGPFLVGINYLAQHPTSGQSGVSSTNPSNYATGYWVDVYSSGNKYYYAYGGPGSSTSSSGSLSSTPSTINITVVITYNGIGNPFNAPSGTATIYINGKNVGSMGITLPQWYGPIYSYSFNNYAYIFTNHNGVGSWVVMMLQNAALINATIEFFNKYTLPMNTYVAVSLNNQPAIGVIPSILNITMNGVTINPIQYTVCNITSNAIIFNVTLPIPIGYPYNQYLLAINNSGIVTLLNPFSPSVLNYLGIPNALNITAMAAYQLTFYNEDTGSVYQVPYIVNNGIPTLILFYNGKDTSVYNGYIDLTPVSIASSLSIMPERSAILKFYTLTELLIHLPPGYTSLNYTISPSVINQVGEPQSFVNEYYYSPSETHEALPITYAPTTITGCQSQYGVNYELYFINYGNYWAYENYWGGGSWC